MTRLHVGLEMWRAEKTDGRGDLGEVPSDQGEEPCRTVSRNRNQGRGGGGQSQSPDLAEDLPENKVLKWGRCQPIAAGSARQGVGTGWKLAAADSSPGTRGEVEQSEAQPSCQQRNTGPCQLCLIPTPSPARAFISCVK